MSFFEGILAFSQRRLSVQCVNFLYGAAPGGLWSARRQAADALEEGRALSTVLFSLYVPLCERHLNSVLLVVVFVPAR